MERRHLQEKENRLVERCCPQCLQEPARELPHYSRTPWRVVQCEKCDFVYLRNPPNYDQLEYQFAWETQFLDEKKRRSEDRPVTTMLDRATRWRLDAFRRSRSDLYSQIFPAGPVLDIGCANRAWRDKDHIPYGIEISRELHLKAEQEAVKFGGRVIHGPAADAIEEFPNDMFSGVIASSVLEHEMQPRKLLAGIARVLRADGRVYVRVPNYGSINRILTRGQWCGFRHPDHVNYFTVVSLRKLAGKSGLSLKLLHPIRLPLDDNINGVMRLANQHT